MKNCFESKCQAFILIILLLISTFISIAGMFCLFDVSSLYSNNKWDYCLPLPIINQTNHSVIFVKNGSIATPNIIIGLLYLVIISVSIGLINCFYQEKKNISDYSLLHYQHREKYLKLLYISHFLSCWGDRMWQFAIPVILMIVFKNTFMPTAVYCIIIYVGNMIAMQYIGNWIDKNNRFQIQKKSITIENIAIVLSSAIISCLPFLVNINNINMKDKYIIYIGVPIIVLGIIGETMNNAQIISTEKDWIIIISESTDYSINTINKILKRIDLICKILAPATIGIIIDRFDDNNQQIFVAGLVIGIWNILSFPLEIILKTIVYNQFPELRKKIHHHINGTIHSHEDGEQIHDHIEGENWFDIEHIHSNIQYHKKESCCNFSSIKLYFSHPICLASLSASMLWMTVLSNGSIMTNYLQWRKVDLTIIGISRGLGALMGVIGTYLFGCINTRTKSEEKTGALSLWSFWIILLPILITFILKRTSLITDYTLMGSCILSRSMLWMFELSLQNIMQKNIEEENRGKINTMHTTMYQLFYILINIFGIVFFKPEHFFYLVIISIVAVGSSVITYTFWYKNI
jgi:solute carrier family 40 (iron-regulated transporter), member 1